MEKKSRKSIVIGITSLFLVMLILVGLTYAYYRTRIIGNDSTDPSISVQSKKMEITYEDGSAVLSTTGKIEPGFTASKTFYVKNTGNETVKYSVILDEMVNEYQRNQDWQVTLTKNGTEVIKSTDNMYLAVGTHQVLLGSVSIAASGTDAPTTDTYVLTITYKNLTDEDQSEDMGMNLSFKVNISEETYTFESAPSGSLLNAIKTNSPVSATVTVPGQAISTAEEAVLASTEDDYGTSYYFRGAVKNNYVNYSGMCWRIARVQGDGTIKLVLADEKGLCNANTYSVNNKTTAFINDNETYRYSSSEATYASGDIPGELSTWMTSKITDTSDLVTTEWCNDMSISNISSYDVFDEVYTDLNYGAYGRLGNKTTASPSLKCNMKGFNNSKAIRYESNIGILTADEVAFAGGVSSTANSTYYLSTNANGGNYWTMSPYDFIDEYDYPTVWSVDSAGYLVNDRVDVNYAVRPAIVLKNNVLLDKTISGQNGTYSNPYVLN